MPNIANIVVADATPVNHTFLPQRAAMELSTWVTKEAVTHDGNPRLAIVMSPPASNRKTTRNKLTLTIPFEREVDGVTRVADTIIYTIDVVIPANCSDAEADKAYTMFKNLVAHATVESYCVARLNVF